MVLHIMEEGSKLYYTVGDVSKILGENASLVRFWSDKFSSFIKPVRNKKGNRFFTQKDIGTFKMIHHLVKESGMTLEGAKARLKQNLSGADSKLEVIEKLRSIRAKLVAVMQDEELSEEPFSTRIISSSSFISVSKTSCSIRSTASSALNIRRFSSPD